MIDDDLPDMEVKSSRDREKQSKEDTKRFRAREKAATEEAENEGLPSVNRRKGANKLVTIAGFLFIFGVAIVMIINANMDKTPKSKKNQSAEITNNLPPLVIPPPPEPPIAVAEQPASSTAQPDKNQNGKPPMNWTDRKMSGTLLISAQQNGNNGTSSSNDSSRPATATAANTQQSNNDVNNKFAAQLEPTITNGVSASILPNRNFLIAKGKSLDCVLETALDSSLAGIVTCVLTRDIYSDNTNVLLLDKGTQLVGEYQGGIKQGQIRVFVLWTRAKTPNGVIVSLNSPGTDSLGRSGLEGWVDNHFAARFGAAIMMSLIQNTVTAVANHSSTGAGGTSGVSNYYANSGNGGERVVEKILESTVNIPPTIVKNQGESIQVMVARDLDFSGVYGLKVMK